MQKSFYQIFSYHQSLFLLACTCWFTSRRTTRSTGKALMLFTPWLALMQRRPHPYPPWGTPSGTTWLTYPNQRIISPNTIRKIIILLTKLLICKVFEHDTRVIIKNVFKFCVVLEEIHISCTEKNCVPFPLFSS